MRSLPPSAFDSHKATMYNVAKPKARSRLEACQPVHMRFVRVLHSLFRAFCQTLRQPKARDLGHTQPRTDTAAQAKVLLSAGSFVPRDGQPRSKKSPDFRGSWKATTMTQEESTAEVVWVAFECRGKGLPGARTTAANAAPRRRRPPLASGAPARVGDDSIPRASEGAMRERSVADHDRSPMW